MDERLDDAIAAARGVLFLCSGNAVRSPFAELYARHLGCALPLESAATVFENATLFPETRAALLARGVDARTLDAFRSRRIDRLPATAVEPLLVFGMTRAHLAAWGGTGQEQIGRRFLLAELLGERREIADPVLDGVPFEGAFEDVARCVEALVARIARFSN